MKTKYTMKTKNRMNLGLLSFVACFTAAPAWAAFLTVGPTENYTHHTITAAIAAASAGDTITVFTGTYAGDLTLDEAITLTGSNVVVDGNVSFGAAVTVGGGVTVKNGHSCNVVSGGSIQTAVTAAPVGGTVTVAAGPYIGDLSITKALTLTGTSAVVNGDITFGAAVTMTGVTVQNDAHLHDSHVVPGGSIQNALDAALAGSTVNVDPGTYVGNPVITQVLRDEEFNAPMINVAVGKFKVANRGTAPAWPVFTLSAPTTGKRPTRWWISNGSTSNMVRVPPIYKGEHLIVDTNPEHRIAISAIDPVDDWTKQIIRNSGLLSWLNGQYGESGISVLERFHGQGFSEPIAPGTVATLTVFCDRTDMRASVRLPQRYERAVS